MAETHVTTARKRPLSPHLTVFRPLITMVMSIAHRITGGALYFGMLFLAWWLIAMSMPKAFEVWEPVVSSWFGRLVLFGFTWAFIHHMLGGLRHLVWDSGHGLEPAVASTLAWATLVGSVALTLVVWIIGYAVR